MTCKHNYSYANAYWKKKITKIKERVSHLIAIFIFFLFFSQRERGCTSGSNCSSSRQCARPSFRAHTETIRRRCRHLIGPILSFFTNCQWVCARWGSCSASEWWCSCLRRWRGWRRWWWRRRRWSWRWRWRFHGTQGWSANSAFN